MASTAILTTYGVNDIREDVVLNAIEILTARESQITNLVQRGSAIATVHSYLTDTLKAVASLAVAEQADYTATELQTPARLTNVIEIIAKNFKVSRTQQQVQHFQGENELQRQTRKGLMDWANAYEFDFIRSALTSGASGTAPKMSKLIRYIFTSITRAYGETKKMSNLWRNSFTLQSETMLGLLPQN